VPPPGPTGRQRNNAFNLSVRLSVRSFVCYKTCEYDVLKMNEPNFTLSGQLHETVNFRGQEVKGQGHTRPKIDLEAFGRVAFPLLISKKACLIFFTYFNNLSNMFTDASNAN